MKRGREIEKKKERQTGKVGEWKDGEPDWQTDGKTYRL